MPKIEDDEIVHDGQTVRISMFTMDALQRAVVGNVTVPALCRPGYVQLNDAQMRDKVAAHASYNQRVGSAWKKPPPLAPKQAQDVNAPARSQTPGNETYTAYDKRLSERWRGKAA